MRGQFYSHNTCINTCWYAQKCYLESEPNQEENATFKQFKSLFQNKSDNPQRHSETVMTAEKIYYLSNINYTIAVFDYF